MLTDTQFVKFLFETGQFWRPENQNGLNVGLADLSTLTLNDRVSQDACAAWQESDINFDILAQMHGRSVVRGEVCPITRIMMGVPRCSMPDVAPPAGATFSYEDQYLQAAVESMQRFSGSGSFPIPGCDPKRKNQANEHSIIINADLTNAPQFVKDNFDAIVLGIRKACAQKGLAARYDRNGRKEATHYFVFVRIGGSTIGINYYPQGTSCNQIVTGRIDSSFSTSIQGWSTLWMHEQIGHGIGLNHYRGGYMNASLVISSQPLTIIGDPTERKWDEFFDGKQIPLDDDTLPVPPLPGLMPTFLGELEGDHNPAGGIAFRGVVDVVIPEGLKPGRYSQIVVPSAQLGKFHFAPKW